MPSLPALSSSLVRTALAALVIAGVTLPALTSAQAASTTVAFTSATVVRWVDGDTVVTTKGTVRLVGLDTPERGRCGYAKATAWAKRWAPAGSIVRLGNPSSVTDRDKYGRLLRYVIAGSRDIQRSQIIKGAKARYDARDGYQWHPRQDSYRRTDSRRADYRCATTTGPTAGGGSYAPVGDSCPANAPIKGNESSMIYHMPGQRYYDVTVPEECFASEAAAQAAGYRAAKV